MSSSKQPTPSAKTDDTHRNKFRYSYWSDSLFENSLLKSKLKPHTFFEGYGSIIDNFTAGGESSRVKTWSRIVVEHFLQKVRKTYGDLQALVL